VTSVRDWLKSFGTRAGRRAFEDNDIDMKLLSQVDGKVSRILALRSLVTGCV